MENFLEKVWKIFKHLSNKHEINYSFVSIIYLIILFVNILKDGAIEEDCPEDVSDQASNGPANPYGHRR